MYKISIIVPVYKTEQYLDKCISSILESTYDNFELLLIDDGSPDNCPKKCDHWSKIDSRIKVIHKTNGGLSDSRNVGIDNSTGDYICFIDSDDIISSNMLEDLINLAKKYNSEIICFNFAHFLDNEQPMYKRYTNEFTIETSKSLKFLLEDKISNHACNKIFNKRVFKDIRFPLNRKYEDIGIMYKLLSNCSKITICDGKYYGYLTRSESITHDVKQESIDDMIFLINERYQYFIDNNILIEEAIVSKLDSIYLYHLKSSLNRKIYYSDSLNKEYSFFKNSLNISRIYNFLKVEKFNILFNKIIFIFSKNIFYIIKNRRGTYDN